MIYQYSVKDLLALARCQMRFDLEKNRKGQLSPGERAAHNEIGKRLREVNNDPAVRDAIKACVSIIKEEQEKILSELKRQLEYEHVRAVEEMKLHICSLESQLNSRGDNAFGIERSNTPLTGVARYAPICMGGIVVLVLLVAIYTIFIR